jgi:hypothetical protein
MTLFLVIVSFSFVITRVLFHYSRVYSRRSSFFRDIKNFHFYDYFCVVMIYDRNNNSDDNLNYYYTFLRNSLSPWKFFCFGRVEKKL